MTRIKATLLHFCASTLIVGSVLAMVFLVWYPFPYFSIVGAFEIVKILVLVDLVVGPLLTLVLFKPGKWGLKFDMACVFVMQFCALLYGSHLIYQERPYYMVFAVDRFEVVAESMVDKSEIDDPVLADKPWTSPIYAVASLPESPQERDRVLEETLFEGKPDIHQRPEFWESYAQGRAKVAKAALPLPVLAAAQPLRAEAIADAMSRYADVELLYVPVMARGEAKTLLLDAELLKPLDVLDIDPWAKPVSVSTALRNP